jgi:hypothetical protein
MANDPKSSKDGKAPAERADAPSSSDELKPEGKRSGRVSFDSRGNSVWEWQLETGVYSRDVSTQKLKKLDLGDLSIAESAIRKGPLAFEEESGRDPGGGFNPYDRGSRNEGSNPYDNARNAGDRIAAKNAPQSAERRPKSLDELRKLSEWIKQQRKTDRNEK